MRHEFRHPVGNLDGMSDLQRHRVNSAWLEQQHLTTRDSQRERRELPASNPAELAAYAKDADTGESDGEQPYVDLGFAGSAQATDADEFDSFGSDDHVELDAA
jgi:hypothetical protein